MTSHIAFEKQNFAALDTPFHYFSTKPLQPKFHGALLRRLHLSNIPIDPRSDNHITTLAREILSEKECENFENKFSHTGRRLEFLMGRIAAKDALRQWAFESFDVILCYNDIEIAQNNQGKPYLACSKLDEFQMIPDISISHCNSTAITALSLNGTHIGVDIEFLGRHKHHEFLKRVFTNDELALFNFSDHTQALLLWTAKEAASKALGTGLMGRRREWQIKQISSDKTTAIINYEGRNFQLRLAVSDHEVISLCQINTGQTKN